jgi:hypothetical protein
MRNSILFPILVAVVLTGGATFFITKSVCSNSESQVVAYLKAKEAEAEKSAYPLGRQAAENASKQAAEAWRKVDELLSNPNRHRDSQKEK